jgi:hypothetical protein
MEEQNDDIRSALHDIGKEYLKEIISKEHPNMKIGNDISIGIMLFDEDGKPFSSIVETININEERGK